MAKPRVHEIAAEMGVDSKVALKHLIEMGEFVKGPSSSVQPAVARKLRARLLLPKGSDASPNIQRPRPSPPIHELSVEPQKQHIANLADTILASVQNAPPNSIAEQIAQTFATSRRDDDHDRALAEGRWGMPTTATNLNPPKLIRAADPKRPSKAKAHNDVNGNSKGKAVIRPEPRGFVSTVRPVAIKGTAANPLPGQKVIPRDHAETVPSANVGNVLTRPTVTVKKKPVDLEAVRSEARRKFVTRSNSSWKKYGFTSSQQQRWVRMGLRPNQAHIAAMCRSMTAEGVRVTPDSLSHILAGGRTVLQELNAGANMIRVLDLLATRIAVDFNPEFDHRVVPVLLDSSSPQYGAADITALPGSSAAVYVPQIADFFETKLRAAVFDQTAQRLMREKATFESTKRVGAMLKLYGQAHGIFDDHDLMTALLDNLPREVREPRRDDPFTDLLVTAVKGRRFYHLSSEAYDHVKQMTMNKDHLIDTRAFPSATGFVVIQRQPYRETLEADVLIWTVNGTILSASILPLADLTSEMFTAPQVATEATHRSGANNDPVRLAFAIATLIKRPIPSSSQLRERQNFPTTAESLRTLSPDIEAKPRELANDFVALVYAPGELRQEAQVVRNGKKAETRWIVQGHWRQQWYPSKKERQQIWIEEHESGLFDGVIVPRDHVRVVR